MLNRQNFETIDKIQVSKHEYLRLIHFTGENPEHYVVAKYHVDGHKATNSTVIDLMACEHFIGDTAEVDAESYYLYYVDPEEFPKKDLSTLKSWQASKSYVDDKLKYLHDCVSVQ